MVISILKKARKIMFDMLALKYYNQFLVRATTKFNIENILDSASLKVPAVSLLRVKLHVQQLKIKRMQWRDINQF